MNHLTTFFACLFLLVAAVGASAENYIRDMQAGPMKLSFNSGGNGFALRYSGVSLIKESTLWVHNPSWAEHYYGYSNAANDIQITDVDGGKQAVINHISPSFNGRHIVTLTPNSATFEFHYKVVGNIDDADMEYCFGYISASPIAGCPFSAETTQGTVTGVVPQIAKFSGMEESQLFPGDFRKLVLDTRIGKVTIQVTGDPDGLTIFDARKNVQPWAEVNPVFWCGVLGKHLDKNTEYVQKVTISVEPSTAKQVPVIEPVSAKVTATETNSVRQPASGPVLVIPEPKSITFQKGDFPLNAKTQIVVANDAKEKDRIGAKLFADEVKDLYKLQIPIVTEKEASADGSHILVGESSRIPAAFKQVQNAGVNIPVKEEGYALLSTPKTVVVMGYDQAGTFYGMQTLRQLVKSNEKGLFIQGCKIEDYPSLKFRGVHLFIGKDALPFHEKLIDRILTRYKFNNLVLEADYLKWKSAPKIAVDFSMSQSDLKKEIAYAKDRFLDVSPLVQSLGHSEWMFKNGQNLDLVEDPEHPYAYCVSKPGTYDFIFKIYDEAVDLFKPKYFHIGHDEVTMIGGYPRDAECKKHSAGDLVIGDIQKIHDHLAKKGVKVMMWGDMFLAPGESPDATNAPNKAEAERRRNLLPKDVVIADWHYAPADPSEFQSTEIWKKDGFKQVVSTWYTPANIANFSAQAKKQNIWGLLQTTWAGYDSEEKYLKPNYDQFTAFILAGEYAWDGGKTSLEDLPYKADEEFKRQWDMIPPDLKPRGGFTLDLSPLYNTSLADNDLSSAPKGVIRLKGVLSQMAADTKSKSAIRLAGALDTEMKYPETVTIPLGRTVKNLVFLQTCVWPESPSLTIGSYKVHYQDGTFVEIPVIYGDNIAALTDTRACPNGLSVWSGLMGSGQKAVIRQMIWTNPNPLKSIESIEMISKNTEASPVLLALSAITD